MSTALATDPVAQARACFEAWRRRDAAAVLATLAPGGTYEDPLTGGPIAVPAFAGYRQGLRAVFPDLDFTLGDVLRAGDGRVLGAWRMHGHNQRSFNGLSPTGRAVDLPGVDLIVAGAAGPCRRPATCGPPAGKQSQLTLICVTLGRPGVSFGSSTLSTPLR